MDEPREQTLKMYGGIWGGVIPILILMAGLAWISLAPILGESETAVEGQEAWKPDAKAFWVAGWLAIVVGLFLARVKKDYCRSILRGLGDKNGIVIVTAWIFAGIFGKLMAGGGLVEGLLWFGTTTGAEGAIFTLIAFFLAMLYSSGTGTSVGTYLSLVPVVYPAGVFLGCNPVTLALALLGGAAFGDNLAPISDTTIVSAYTQGATMKDVVKSRFPLAISAAGAAAVLLVVFGGGGAVDASQVAEQAYDPMGLLMLISFGLVIASALSGRHILESLIYGNVSAIVLGMIRNHFRADENWVIFHFPAVKGESTGLIQNGIAGVEGAVIFALLVLALTQVLVDSGVMRSFLKFAEKSILKTVRQAEFSIIFITIVASIPIASNAAAELMVGPSLVKPIGEKFKLAAARRANLMDCAVCTVFYMLPWHVAVIVWHGTLIDACSRYGLEAPSIIYAGLNPYAWALLVVLLFSAFTGWNRKFADTSGGATNATGSEAAADGEA
ncbi:MAG: sodium:proton antiporter [Planctomycetes bacterium]|nr:sodium:proton antiporter [Planctomycetota bacterium]